MLHLRLVVPSEHGRAVADFLREDPRTTNVVVLPGAALDPAGDAVTCDVAREGASDVIDRLRVIGLDERGLIAIEEVDASPSGHAKAAERAAPGRPDDGVVWDVVLERADDDAAGSWSFYAFMVLATAIAAVAVVLDSSILVVGAMVVGPEFGAVFAVAVGLVLGRRGLSGRGLRLLLQGFGLAVAVVAVLALAAHLAGWVGRDELLAPRPLTDFIWKPDRWSFVVALLAGCAGTLSLTSGRSNALVGVFISVTTIPAAGNLALAVALWTPSEMGGAVAQLAVNLVGMVLAGSLTLLVLRAAQRRLGRRLRSGAAATR